MKKIKKGVKNAKPKFDAKTIQEAIEFVKANNLRKVAHRPSGKLTWVHMVELPPETRDAIRDYLTSYPDMSIHHLAQLALEKFLEVPVDERIPYVMKAGASKAKRKSASSNGDNKSVPPKEEPKETSQVPA